MKQVLKLKSDMSELDRLHRFMETLGRRLCLSKKCIVETNLALEEVFSNIVSYADANRTAHFIKISAVTKNRTTLILRVEDKGKSFNPLEAKQPDLKYDLESCDIGGLGIHLVRQLMDELSYERCEDKNVFEMKKSITAD